jgi:hypothetical protein
LKHPLLLSAIILFSTLSNPVQAQQESWSSRATINYFEFLYNFSFIKSDSCLHVQLTSEPDYYRYFLITNEKWWQLVTTGNIKYYSECMAGMINGTESLEKSKLSFHEKNFLHICFESFKLRLMLYDKQYLKAYSQSKSVVAQIQPVLGLEKNFNPYYLTSGLYNYFASTGREKYPLLFTNKNFKTASKVVGLGYLETCSQSNVVFLNTEANYFLMKIYLEIEENPEKAQIYSNRLLKLYGNNIIYQYYQLNILLNLKRTQQAKEQYLLVLRLIEGNTEISSEQKIHLKDITEKLYKEKK